MIYRSIEWIARSMALIGGVCLTALAILMSISIFGGGIAKFAHSEWAGYYTPMVAEALQSSGIRTISGMYEIMQMGMAFVIFSFLPLAQKESSHAIVDIFTKFSTSGCKT